MGLKRRGALGLGAVGALAIVATGTTSAIAEGWKPVKPVEFVVMAGQGGGADKLARFIQSIIEKNKFAEVPFIPVNKGGDSGADALRTLKDNAGNDHMIMATLNSYYTTPLRNPGIGVNIEEFTPIIRLAEDAFILWVNSETDIKSVDDYAKVVKEKGTGWKMGGTGSGQEDSLVTTMLEKAYGLKMTYVPFKGGGTVAANLVGNHVNSTVNNPSEAIGFQQAGKVRPLAALTAERLPLFPDVPTFKELGKDLVYRMQRSVVAPGGLKPEVAAYYTALFEKVFKSEEWQGYCKKNALQCTPLTGEPLKAYFAAEKKAHEALLKEMGEIK